MNEEKIPQIIFEEELWQCDLFEEKFFTEEEMADAFRKKFPDCFCENEEEVQKRKEDRKKYCEEALREEKFNCPYCNLEMPVMDVADHFMKALHHGTNGKFGKNKPITRVVYDNEDTNDVKPFDVDTGVSAEVVAQRNNLSPQEVYSGSFYCSECRNRFYAEDIDEVSAIFGEHVRSIHGMEWGNKDPLDDVMEGI